MISPVRSACRRCRHVGRCQFLASRPAGERHLSIHLSVRPSVSLGGRMPIFTDITAYFCAFIQAVFLHCGMGLLLLRYFLTVANKHLLIHKVDYFV